MKWNEIILRRLFPPLEKWNFPLDQGINASKDHQSGNRSYVTPHAWPSVFSTFTGRGQFARIVGSTRLREDRQPRCEVDDVWGFSRGSPGRLQARFKWVSREISDHDWHNSSINSRVYWIVRARPYSLFLRLVPTLFDLAVSVLF